MLNITITDTSAALPPPRSTNATISGGNCSVYANGLPRSCYDCLNFAVDAVDAQDGCTLNVNGQCVLKSSVSIDAIATETSRFGKYCEASDERCYGCLKAFRLWSSCSNDMNNCICIRKCEPASRLTYDVDTSDIDAAASNAVTMGVVIGCAMVAAFFGCVCLVNRSRRTQRNPPVGSGYDAPQPASDVAYVAQCSPEVRIFEDAIVVSSADKYNSSGLTFAQVVDTTPSAPPLESIRFAVAPSLETSATARSTTATSLY